MQRDGALLLRNLFCSHGGLFCVSISVNIEVERKTELEACTHAHVIKQGLGGHVTGLLQTRWRGMPGTTPQSGV